MKKLLLCHGCSLVEWYSFTFLHISAFDAFGCFVVIYILCTVKTIANKSQDAVARLALTSSEKDDYVSIIHS